MTPLKKPNELTVPVQTGAATTALVYPAERNDAVAAALILAHGAGAGQRSTFMVEFARALSGLGGSPIGRRCSKRATSR